MGARAAPILAVLAASIVALAARSARTGGCGRPARTLVVRARALAGAIRDGRSPPPSGAAALALGVRIDLNRATQGDLEALPGIGPALARRIVEDRGSRGPYPNVEALGRVPGVGPVTLGRLRDLVTARSSTEGAPPR